MPADETKRLKLGPVFPRVQYGKLLAPPEVAGEIYNFRITTEGSLRAICGPTPYLPLYAGTLSVAGRKTANDYTRMHGLFHATLRRGQRDVLLLHAGEELWTFEGWNKGWRVLISATDSSAHIPDRLTDDSRARAPTQFVATPNGIVIIPQAESDSHSYFYDGEVILPLGYSGSPAAPAITGPTTPADHDDQREANTEGYDPRRHTMNRGRMAAEFFHGKFGTGRIGSISTVPDRDPGENKNPIGAPFLLPGEWRGAVQWIDYFGNLSPMSEDSQSVRLYRRPIGWKDESRPYPGETLQHQFIWAGVDKGPIGTIGRMLYRTKDTLNSGTNYLFEMPSSAFGRESQRTVELISATQFATVPENGSETFPDNVPDSALIAPAPNVIPVPRFKIGRVAMGRLFVANTEADPGAVLYSSLGRWGTFERDSIIFPDPSGREITALWRIQGGVLAFTPSSAYAVTPSDDGNGFKSFPISTTVGCVAPDSIAELQSGLIIWLAHDGFYSFDGESVSYLATPIEEEMKTIVKSRMVQATAAVDPVREEYICWVPTNDSVYNNKGFVFDGNGWKTRGGAQYVALCATRDHRQYMLGAGIVPGDHKLGVGDTFQIAVFDVDELDAGSTDNIIGQGDWGVWVLDHESRSFYPDAAERNPIFETSWIGAGESERKTALTVRVWFRETSTTEQVRVRIYRDWRKDDEVHSALIDLDSPEDPCPAWGVTTKIDKDEWQKRRPFWIRKDIYIPSCEVFKLRFEGISQEENDTTLIPAVYPEVGEGTLTTTLRTVPADIEIIGLIVDEAPRPGSGRTPRSG